MTREEFIELSGGIFKSKKDYLSWNGEDKKENFWDFFKGKVTFGNKKLEYDKEILSIYGGIPIEDLIERQLHSIEHIVPKDFLRKYLKKRYYTVRRGATVNPFNFAAAHRSLNTARGSFPFDFEEDKLIASYKINMQPSYTDYGLDNELEWVIPTKTKGDVARAVLYMCLIYNVKGMFGRYIDELVKWAKFDPPTFWEIKYNQWVHRRLGIRNPFIEYAMVKEDHPYYGLLKDDELLNSIRDHTVEIDPALENRKDYHAKRRRKGQENSVQIIAALVNPFHPDSGFENITLMNVCPENVYLNDWWIENDKGKTYYFGDEYIDSGTFKKIALTKNTIQLSNRGGTLTLYSHDDKVIHQVSYTAAQARKSGWMVTFR